MPERTRERASMEMPTTYSDALESPSGETTGSTANDIFGAVGRDNVASMTPTETIITAICIRTEGRITYQGLPIQGTYQLL